MGYDLVAIGNRAYQARVNIEINQEDIAAKLGMHQATYSKFENGRYELPLSKLFTLCEILDVRLSWLLGEVDTELSTKEQLELARYKKFIISNRK